MTAVAELRPPCECGATSLTAYCPLTTRFVVLRAELTTSAARRRRWLCGACLLQAITTLLAQPATRGDVP